MQRKSVLGAVVIVMVLVGGALAPASAQDDPQDVVRAAFLNLINLETYSADVAQQVDQDIAVAYQGVSVNLVQTITSEGTLQLERVAGARYDNMAMSLTQSLTGQTTGMGQDQTTEVNGMQYDLIVLDERIYMQFQMPPEYAAGIPVGWYDVTDGADIFPGMDLINMDQLLGIGNMFDSEEGVDMMISAILTIDMLDPETVEGQTFDHYQLTLDPRVAAGALGMASIEDMFNAETLPFDVTALIDLIYNDEKTRYTLDLLVGADDQMIYDYNIYVSMDVEIDPAIITDATLTGAEMTMAQEITQSIHLRDFNAPVTIKKPVLAEEE